MGLVREDIATVYHGGGRRWFKLTSACRAEARARAKAKYGRDYGQDEGVDIDRTMRAVSRLTRLYVRLYRASHPSPNRPVVPEERSDG